MMDHQSPDQLHENSAELKGTVDPVSTPSEQFVSKSIPKSNVACLHCGQPTTTELDSTELDSFCCGGCQAAYNIIRGEGLEEYYALRQRTGASQSAAVDLALQNESFVDFDSPRFWQSNVTPLPNGFVQTTLRLRGIHCAACVWLLERLPKMLPGVIDARVNLQRLTIELVWKPTDIRLSQIAQQMAKLGYRASSSGDLSKETERKRQNREELIQIAIAAACSSNIMILAIAMYAGEWSGMAVGHMQLMRGASTIIGLICLLGPGSVFIRGAWAAIQARVPHMDIPVALGLIVGAASGLWNTLRDSGHLFFDSLGMLVFLLLVGRAVQSRQQQKACDAVDLLGQLTPGTARRVRDAGVEWVAIDEIVPGDTLEVLPERIVPCDGRVIYGQSEIDASLLTGESRPMQVAPGDEVIAGTLNRSQTFRMLASQVGQSTRVAKIVDRIEQASMQKAPVEQWANKISGIFVIAVVFVAIAVGLTWWWIDANVWTDRVVAVLIVACPCALGLATPLAVAMGLGQAARQGVLIKGGDTLQRLSTSGVLLMDKTGTLTTGQLKVRQWHGSIAALETSVLLEQRSKHPVADALRRYWMERTGGDRVNLQAELAGLETQVGGGVQGQVDGRFCCVGSRAYLESLDVRLTDEWLALERQLSADVYSLLWIAENHSVVSCAVLEDSVRPEASRVIERLASKGWQVAIVSGDIEKAVRHVAQQVGIAPENAFSQVSPEAKLELVQARKQSGKTVIMVGDGVNDAAALAAADIGIAIGGGAEVSLQAADVYLASGSLEGIESVMNVSRRTLRVIRRNSVASLAYNAFSISLAAVGVLHPLVAALLMPTSGLTVILVTLLGHSKRGGRP
jgi:P-type Cu2+ transporter